MIWCWFRVYKSECLNISSLNRCSIFRVQSPIVSDPIYTHIFTLKIREIKTVLKMRKQNASIVKTTLTHLFD